MLDNISLGFCRRERKWNVTEESTDGSSNEVVGQKRKSVTQINVHQQKKKSNNVEQCTNKKAKNTDISVKSVSDVYQTIQNGEIESREWLKHINYGNDEKGEHAGPYTENINIQDSVENEERWARECFEVLKEDGLEINEVTTDPYSSAYRAAECLYQKGLTSTTPIHFLDTTNHTKFVKQLSTVCDIMPARLKVQRTRLQSLFASDMAARCQAEFVQANIRYHKSPDVMKSKLTYGSDAITDIITSGQKVEKRLTNTKFKLSKERVDKLKKVIEVYEHEHEHIYRSIYLCTSMVTRIEEAKELSHEAYLGYTSRENIETCRSQEKKLTRAEEDNVPGPNSPEVPESVDEVVLQEDGSEFAMQSAQEAIPLAG
ncbi:unnamed protein product [Mytilus edulis]|uniref:Uncharacterized protein n=1 Tax=Mytilus edulis TaxID=6550 RepID=A0A8S3R5E9_MYTED|nr:unnamed protein product [Mytilus edulis]